MTAPEVGKKRTGGKKSTAATATSQEAGVAAAATSTTKQSAELVPVHMAEDDDLDAFLETNLNVFREKAFSRLATKSVRKAFLKLVVEGDLLEVTLDEQQLLASLWYLLYRKNKVQEAVASGAGEAEEGAGGSASSEEVTDSELENSRDAEETDEEEAANDVEELVAKRADGEGPPRRGRGPGKKVVGEEKGCTFKY